MDLDALIEAAQEEGELMVYDGANEENVRAWTEAFMAEYDIPVTFVRDGGAALYQQFAQEEAAGQHQAEVISILGRGGLTRRSIMTGSPITHRKGRMHCWMNSDHPATYYPVQSLIAPVITYNTNNVTEEEVAQLEADSWGFLGTSGLTNRITVVAPRSGRTSQALWYLYAEGLAPDDFGWDAVDATADNMGRVSSGTVLAAQDVVQGEFDFGIGYA